MTLAVSTGVAAAGLLVVVVLLLRASAARRRLRGDLDDARRQVDELATRVAELDAALTAPPAEAPAPTAEPATGPADQSRRARPETEYVITSVGDVQVPAPDRPVPAPLSAGQFASVAVGESLVRVLSFGHGLRRALSAENRNRIAFEMRREVKRSRKQRRREVKQARRHLRSADRADLAEDAA